MGKQTKTVRIVVRVAIALVVLGCAGLFTFGIPIQRYSDKYASLGEYFNPLRLLGPHASSSHYIEVGGKTYRYASGITPGYFIVPELDWMVFQTESASMDGWPTIHIRDLKSGDVTDISVPRSQQKPWLVEQASCGGCRTRWWIHSRTPNEIQFGVYVDRTYLEFTTIDLKARAVRSVEGYWFNPDGTPNVDRLAPSVPLASRPTAAQLIGEHWREAGLPEQQKP